MSLYAEKTLTNLSSSPLLPTKKDSQLFVNREKEVRKIRLAIQTNMNVLIVGERGSGKTSLLNHVQHILQENRNIMFVDVSMSFGVETPLDFLNSLAVSLSRQCMKLPSAKREQWLKLIKSVLTSMSIIKGVSVSIRGETEEEFDTFGYSILDRLEELLLKLSRSRIKVCFILDNSDKNPALFYNILSSLRDFLWRTRACFIAVADLSAISFYKKPPIDAFFDVIVTLKPLSFDETAELIRLRLGVNHFPDRIYNLINEESKGNPREMIQIMQRVLERTFEVTTFQNDAYSSKKHVSSRETRMSKSKFEKELVSFLKERENVRISTSDELTTSQKSIVEYLERYGPCSASNNDFQSTFGVGRTRLVHLLVKLEKKGILTATKRGRQKLYYVSHNLVEKRSS